MPTPSNQVSSALTELVALSLVRFHFFTALLKQSLLVQHMYQNLRTLHLSQISQQWEHDAHVYLMALA
jgi:hypothetical protein